MRRILPRPPHSAPAVGFAPPLACGVSDCAGPWHGGAATEDGPLAVAGIAQALLEVAVLSEGLALSLAEDSLTLSRHQDGAGRTAHDVAVSCDGGLLSARLGAVAAAPRGGTAAIATTLSLHLAVANLGETPLATPLLRLGWSAAMPGQPDGLHDEHGGAVALRIDDARAAQARFTASVTGPGVGDRKSGGTPGRDDAPGDLPGRPFGAAGWVVPLLSPDRSETVWPLPSLPPGGVLPMRWTVQVTASVDAASGRAGERVAALTGAPRHT